MVIRFSISFIEDRHVKVMLGTSVLSFNKGKSLGSSAVHGTYVCIDTTSPNQDTTSPGAKQLAFWTQLAYNFRHCYDHQTNAKEIVTNIEELFNSSVRGNNA